MTIDSRNELMALYQEWRDLSEAEGQAIRSAIWSDVDECQNAKGRLQSRILSATELLQADLVARGENPQCYDAEFRNVVAELILLEERNSKWLAEVKEAKLAQRQELNRSSQNLRQVRRAYTRNRQPAWNSYS